MSLQLLIFDVDGTLAETEEIQRKAFNRRQEDQLFIADEVRAKHDNFLCFPRLRYLPCQMQI